jgi:hypothetical protein
MRIPEFTAEASLGKPLGRYRSLISSSSVSSGSIQAQAACYCSEPDFKRVCTSPGHCYNQKVCLQWSCPSKGQEIDDDDLAGYFGLSPS